MAPDRVQGLTMPKLIRRVLDRAAGQRPVEQIPLPRRGDHVEAWLRRQRDQFNPHSPVWNAFDRQLDDYRLHADTRTPLHEHACDGPYCEHEEADRV